jgi:hypothetical protein
MINLVRCTFLRQQQFGFIHARKLFWQIRRKSTPIIVSVVSHVKKTVLFQKMKPKSNNGGTVSIGVPL